MRIQNTISNRLIDWLAIGWLGVITYLSLGPPTTLPALDTGDKIEHVSAYALLAMLATPRRRRYSTFFGTLVAIAVYGGLIEFLQPHVNRQGELNDFLANCAGVILGTGVVLAFTWLNVWRRKR